MKITGCFVIQTGIVNKNASLGTVQYPKTVASNGVKVYFSSVSYKSALWTLLEQENWNPPFVIGNKVMQKFGTVIDSEEIDFAGSMLAPKTNNDDDSSKKGKGKGKGKGKDDEGQEGAVEETVKEKEEKKEKETKGFQYSRLGSLSITRGISVNDFAGDFEFSTNGRLASLSGYGETSIIQKATFEGIYVMPFMINVNDVGYQELPIFQKPPFSNDETMEEKIIKLYEAFASIVATKQQTEFILQQIKKNMPIYLQRVKSIEYVSPQTVVIQLTKEEKIRRIKELLSAMGILYRRIEGEIKTLSPIFSVFSTTSPTPFYELYIKKILQKQYNDSRFDIQELYKVKDFVERKGYDVYVADMSTYDQAVDKVIEQLMNGLKDA